MCKNIGFVQEEIDVVESTNDAAPSTIAPIEVSGCVEEQIDVSGSSMIVLEDSLPFTNLMDPIVFCSRFQI
uniref:Uncharacterized protein n=1 Tax=Medicago truncatula TaxID=3880 RepID=A2Q4C5_MEDTR|nr:hypothetical protein MtrDRAFT_AC157472g12v2 [Medicago truncatula]